MDLIEHYAMFNPHATIAWEDTVEKATSADWRKWLPTDPTSSHWYNRDTLRQLMAAYLKNEREGGKAYTVREFVSEFAGFPPQRSRRRL